MGKRKVYQEKMEAQLKEWGADIDKLKTIADNAVSETKLAYYEQIELLHDLQESVQVKLHEMKTASDEGWEHLKEGTEKTWNQLKDALHKATDKFK